jgi:membrane protein DedA with SNARE-associated domain
MTAGQEIAALIAAHGLWVLIPLAVIEGPVITVVVGGLASLGLVDPALAFALLVLADLAGDSLLYAGGRGLRIDRIPVIGHRLHLPRARIVPLVRGMRRHATRLMVLGKLTHAAGFAVLIAAGAARVSVLQFVVVNLLASLPKTLVFFALGYAFGQAQERIGHWLSVGSGAVVLALAIGGGLALVLRHRSRRALPSG